MSLVTLASSSPLWPGWNFSMVIDGYLSDGSLRASSIATVLGLHNLEATAIDAQHGHGYDGGQSHKNGAFNRMK